MVYYNDNDKDAVAWLKNLISLGLLPQGEVDDRSITEVTVEDLRGFTQWHFFAGIGGWPLALKLAGIPETWSVCTGSPCCQPFSQAGKQRGKFDPRHLAPTYLRLVKQLKPEFMFGEQVAKAVESGWLDDMQNEMENSGYSFGASILNAAILNAPHRRERLYFGAVSNVVNPYGNSGRVQISGSDGKAQATTLSNWQEVIKSWESVGAGEDVLRVWEHTRQYLCRDGKWRKLPEPGIPLLVDGLSTPMGLSRHKGFGNAIVPQIGALWVQEFMKSVDDCVRGEYG